MQPSWHPRTLLRSAALACLSLALAGCQPAPPSTPDWRPMMDLLGDWSCDAHFQTPHGDLVVPMITEVRRGVAGRWLQIHREAPGWTSASGHFVEDSYTGWDPRRAQWVTTVHNNFGVAGYLTSTGFHLGIATWDEHPFTDVSLPLRARVLWRKPSPTQWTIDMPGPANPTRTTTTLTNETCQKRDPPPLPD